jgi:hypothetical protein
MAGSLTFRRILRGVRSFRDLREQIARENDPERLRELMLNINVLLNMVEDQVANLERRQFSTKPPNP